MGGEDTTLILADILPSCEARTNIARLRLGARCCFSDAETRSISAENPHRREKRRRTSRARRAKCRRNVGARLEDSPVSPGARRDDHHDTSGRGDQHLDTVDPRVCRDVVLLLGRQHLHRNAAGRLLLQRARARYNVTRSPCVNPSGGFNSYWPMPFRKHARITVESQHKNPIGGFFYQITYALTEVPGDAAYLHAQWRRSLTTRSYPEHVILDGVQGKGHYVGTFLAWTQLSNGWWGEGEVKFYIDGDAEFPTICGTGTEDYFCGAWGFNGETYSTPFLGYPLYRKEPGEVPRHGLYRWHIFDPIRFKRTVKVTIQALGWWPNGKYQPLTDDIASVAYWYQTEPHAPYPSFPPVHERWSR